MMNRLRFLTLLLFSFTCFSFLSAQNYTSSERGTAVYYADYLEGRPTAYGEVYRKDRLTAAHPSYPAGTLLKVTRLDNRRSTVVRVNDRGPFCDGCVIDLSKVAALQLDMLKSGKATVVLEVLPNLEAPTAANETLTTRSLANTSTYNRPANQNSTYPRVQPYSNYQAPAQPSSYGNSQFQSRSINVPPPVNSKPKSFNDYISGPKTNGGETLQAQSVPRSYDSYQTEARQQSTERFQSRSINVPPPAKTKPKSFNDYIRQGASNNSNETFQSRSLNAPQAYDNSSLASNSATYERLQARNLLPEGTSGSAPSFYERGGINTNSGRSVPSSYDQVTRGDEFTARAINPARISPNGNYAVQLASYSNLGNAERQVNTLRQKGLDTVFILEYNTEKGKLYKVVNGPYATMEGAIFERNRFKRELRTEGVVILLK